VDVLRDVDLIEDILRIYGYNRVETSEQVQSNLSYQTATDLSYKLQNLISEQLTSSGFNEILNNSLTASTYYAESSVFPDSRCVRLHNPQSNELNVMRQTLLFGGMESLAYNRNRKNPDLKLYEFGTVYAYNPAKEKETCPLDAICETYHLGIWLTGNKIHNNWNHPDEKSSVYELKAYVENILVRLGINLKKMVYSAFSDELFSSALSIQTFSGKVLGALGIVQKKCCKQFDIASDVYFAELDWDGLMKETKSLRVTYSDIPKFPAVKRDLALLIDKTVSFAEIEKIAYETDKKILKKVSLFDVYEEKNLPAGKKSYAVSFILQDEEKTLNDNQIDHLMNRIFTNLKQKTGAELR